MSTRMFPRQVLQSVTTAWYKILPIRQGAIFLTLKTTGESTENRAVSSLWYPLACISAPMYEASVWLLAAKGKNALTSKR